ncbi:hypothetical protein [Halobacillus mangrovi]|uniref:hypothetical protein n=1 Tax=Halobacillus mangrovi TaxID=402384 RepID=UPI0012F4A8EC|nr:hypothetical protein [Halobacillus mangrovi]
MKKGNFIYYYDQNGTVVKKSRPFKSYPTHHDIIVQQLESFVYAQVKRQKIEKKPLAV